MAHSRIAALAAIILVSGTTWAADDSKPVKDEAKKEPPKDAKKLGSDEAACHTFSRAGFPECISRFAIPTDSNGYCGYYVGGGSVRMGGSSAPPCPTLGTWGRDWCGICFHPRVMLGWGGRYQGGTGAYRTGNRDIPDVVADAVKLPEILHQKREQRNGVGDGH